MPLQVRGAKIEHARLTILSFRLVGKKRCRRTSDTLKKNPRTESLKRHRVANFVSSHFGENFCEFSDQFLTVL